ncbi:molybdopterin-dependent oxidoreductase [Methylocella sp.]|uniref:nitrate reductase n=1 Tax=Methylocella sp. TaxID=1978226 RepID=UPI003783933F
MNEQSSLRAAAALARNSATRTTCPYCGVGCGVLASPDGYGGAQIAGDPEHPANFGRLCSKGSALGETLGLETRQLFPMIDGARAGWDDAIDRVAEGFSRIVAEHGPNAVAFYLSGQLLTEDYYVANKLMKGFIGSANVDTNSRLCMSSSVAGHKRVFGADTVPGCYEDLDEADLLVLVGSNAAWCHPILFQRMVKAQETRGAKIVNVDPRRTATSEAAALELSIRPGKDAALFCGLLAHLADAGRLDRAFIADHTQGFDAALARARELAPDVAATAAETGLAPEDVARFFEMFSSTERVVTLYSQGVNQSAQGTDKVVSILNCHLATGRIGRPGMGPFSLTGQPNAMGGREVGGLANQLAAHMGFSPPEIDRVRRFWNAPRMAREEGLTAVPMFDAIARGEIKALWVMGTNPAVSLPRADYAREAMRRLELFVVSENVASNDTLDARPHVVFPSAAWGEKDGAVTNSERRISRQRAFLPLPGEVRPDWRAMCGVAKKMGFSGFDYESPAEIFAEHARLSAFENDGTRDFDLSGLVGLSPEAYDHMAPAQWPLRPEASGGQKRFFAEGGFFAAGGRASFIAVERPRLPAETSEDYPLLLNTGRMRDQWHTMTRTGLSQRLGGHMSEPKLSIHPADAARAGVADGGLARVSSAHGAAIYRVAVTPAQEEGAIFAPIHWNDETASFARTGALVHPFVDPFSKQPDSKATPARVAPVSHARTGFLLARARARLPRDSYWVWEAVQGGYAAKLETDAADEFWVAALRTLAPENAELVSFADAARGVRRAALVSGGRLAAALFLAPAGDATGWTALRGAFAADTLDAATRRTMLSGRSVGGGPDLGPNVCACFGVPQGAILAAIRDGCRDPAAIGARLKAGTNCGSCIPEMKRMIAACAAELETAG